MKVNSNKSKVVHFRGTHIPVSDFIFRCGQEVLQTVCDYDYLGLLINEFLDFTYTSQAVAKSANRALGLIICKAKAYGGMPYSCFTKLYNALVLPIITYGSAIWGDKSYSHIDAVHNKACRFFFGVGKYTPNAAIQGEMGWPLPIYYHWVTIVMQWQRLHRMSDNRINKNVYVL